jgi:hypothetical protein
MTDRVGDRLTALAVVEVVARHRDDHWGSIYDCAICQEELHALLDPAEVDMPTVIGELLDMIHTIAGGDRGGGR